MLLRSSNYAGICIRFLPSMSPWLQSKLSQANTLFSLAHTAPRMILAAVVGGSVVVRRIVVPAVLPLSPNHRRMSWFAPRRALIGWRCDRVKAVCPKLLTSRLHV